MLWLTHYQPVCFQCHAAGVRSLTKEDALKQTVEKLGWVHVPPCFFCARCKAEFSLETEGDSEQGEESWK